MKILHTADWHLGKRLERFSRIAEQHEVLDEICRIADAEKVDAVLVAGDIYDAFNPPTDAEKLFFKTVKRLSANGRRAVIVIAGNHDSPERIQAPDPLAQENGIIMAGYPDTKIDPFLLESGLAITRSDAGFVELKLANTEAPLRLILTPYANEARLKTFLGFENSELALREALQQRWQTLADKYCDDKGVNMLVAHLMMISKGQEVPEEPDDEKPILYVGGAQAILTNDIPRQIQYTALGHLHGKRKAAGKPCPVYYSSSPLPYSMSEANQDKFVLIIEAEPGKAVKVRGKALKCGKRLLRERFEDVESAVNWLGANQNAWVEIIMETESYLSAEQRRQLTEAHDGIVAIIPMLKAGAEADDPGGPTIDLNQSMEALFIDYFTSRNKDSLPPDDAMLALFREVLGGDES